MKPYPKPLTSVIDLVGNTPLVKLNSFDTNGCELYVKLENQNPGGSIKDRIGVSMIEAAEKEGKLKPGDTIVEATAGNTGLALALVGRLKGYNVLLVVPDKMSLEKISLIKAFGAEVELARSDVEKGHPEYYQEHAARLATERPNCYYINQFSNNDNVLAHEETTGPEIYEQMDKRVDAVISGVGSGGTLAGLSNYFAKVSPETEMILADPTGSVLTGYIETGEIGEVGTWLIEGMGEDFIPDICDLSRVAKAYDVTDSEAFLMARDLLNKEGILAGTSAGALVAAALKYCADQTTPKRVVTFICDSGSKYISKIFNNYWMYDHGLMDRETTGDIRDLVSRRFDEGGVVFVTPGDTLGTAHKRMKTYEVSQLPVIENKKVVGIIDEEDLLVAIYEKNEAFKEAVSQHMVTQLETLTTDSPLENAIKLVREGYVPIVADGDTFYGLITKTDIVSYLRQRNIKTS